MFNFTRRSSMWAKLYKPIYIYKLLWAKSNDKIIFWVVQIIWSGLWSSQSKANLVLNRPLTLTTEEKSTWSGSLYFQILDWLKEILYFFLPKTTLQSCKYRVECHSTSTVFSRYVPLWLFDISSIDFTFILLKATIQIIRTKARSVN